MDALRVAAKKYGCKLAHPEKWLYIVAGNILTVNEEISPSIESHHSFQNQGDLWRTDATVN